MKKIAFLFGVLSIVCSFAHAETPDAFLEYVTLSGSQYIDTGIDAKTGVKVEAVVAWTSLSGQDSTLIGARTDSGDTRFFPIHLYQSKLGYGHGKFTGLSSATITQGKINHIVSDFSAEGVAQITLNDMTFDIGSLPKFDAGKTMYLGAANYKGVSQFAKGYLYGCKIWEKQADGTLLLVRNYLPCVKDGVAALFDTVNETISPSAGSGAFGKSASSLAAVYGEPDRFVEWIESDGKTQYIDVGVKGRSDTSAEIDFEFTRLTPSRNNKQEDALLGAIKADNYGNRTRFYLGYAYEGYFIYGYGALYSKLGFGETMPKVAAGTRYKLSSTLKAGEQTVKLDGEAFTTSAKAEIVTETSAQDTGRSLWLFANNHSLYSDDTGRCYSAARVYSLRIEQDGVLMRDFVPCVKNGEGGLYDRVSGCVFFCANREHPITFGHIPWPEGKALRRKLTKVEYISLDGKGTYFDTGIVGKTGVKAEASAAWDNDDGKQDTTLLGARTDSGSTRFFPLHVSGSTEAGAVLLWGYRTYGKFLDLKVKSQDRHTVIGDFTEAGVVTCTIDGKSATKTGLGAAFDTGKTMYLGAANYNTVSQFMRGKLYSCKIWEKQEDGSLKLVRDFQPAMYDDVAFLWDEVSQTPFLNKGSSVLGAGESIGKFADGFRLLVR